MTQLQAARADAGETHDRSRLKDSRALPLYVLTLVASVSTWLIGIRSPLWLDETVSYWIISRRFWQIWSRAMPTVPAYHYILWASSKVIGTSEVALRIPSLLAMLAAVYVLYRCARELFPRNIAYIAAMIFALHPIVVFAAIDVRPYAFAVLSANCATLFFLRWMRRLRLRDSVCFGISCGMLVYFHFLMAAIFLAFVVAILVCRWKQLRRMAPQAFIAMAIVLLMLLPVIPGVLRLAGNASSHVSAPAPIPFQLLSTLAPGYMIFILISAVMFALAGAPTQASAPTPDKLMLVPFILGVVPLLLLYAISATTPVHIFLERYRIIAIPGIALSWAWLFSRFHAIGLRAIFIAVVAVTIVQNVVSPALGFREFTWKNVLQTADQFTRNDHAPILMSSGLIESDFEPLPSDVEDSPMFTQLSYYPVHSQVIALPRDFNESARAQVRRFLDGQSSHPRRFLLIVSKSSLPTANWISSMTRQTYSVRTLAVDNSLTLMEYVPR